MGCNASAARAPKDRPVPLSPKAHPLETAGKGNTAACGQAQDSAEACSTESPMSQGQADHDDELDDSLQALKVKDEQAWKQNDHRPRSALKPCASSSSSCAEGADAAAERTPSGTRFSRKVSFQVNGFAAPPDFETVGPQEKRSRRLNDVSMKKLVDTFYGKVFEVPALRPFFDDVDMTKLKHQQEALMLLVFGGHELLEDELPGMSADLRLIHLHLLAEGLSTEHWKAFSDKFSETMDEASGGTIPEDVKARAKEYMASTRRFFLPLEPGEWPPKQPYKGWTKKSCPFSCGALSNAAPSDPPRVTAHAVAAQPQPPPPAGADAPAGAAPAE